MLFLVVFLSIFFTRTEQISLNFNSTLSYYEILNLTNAQITSTSHIKQNFKRDINIGNSFLNTNEFKFKAFGRDFHLLLKKDTHLLAESFNIEVRYSNHTRKRVEDFYTANYYIGLVKDESNSNVFLYFDNETLPQTLVYAKIELDSDIFYIEPSDETKNCFVVYRARDLIDQNFPYDSKNSSFCPARRLNETSQFEESKNRTKRDSTLNNRCRIALVADWRFYEKIGNSNEKLTTLYMINIIGAVNNVFTKTDFSNDFRNFGFNIENIIVHADPFDDPNHYNSRATYSDSNKILELFGREDWSAYCLAHLFTYNSFEGNVLGTAYVASPKLSSYGGVCSRLMTRAGRLFSSNIGFSTYKSSSLAQSRLTQREAEIVTLHELGHNWGSEHDPQTDRCTPRQGGNYVMYPSSSQGYDPNNYLFSPCSITWITEVLKTKASVCFSEESKSFCGNNRVEVDEECDGGLDTRRGNDKCCDSQCNLRPTAKCSDKNHECCRDCQIASRDTLCFTSVSYAECFQSQSYCDGILKTCPKQQPKAANTSCNSFDSGKCDSEGHCLSLCQQVNINLFPCKCNASVSVKCMQCCQNTNVCRPLHETLNRKEPFWLSDGRSCVDGVCEQRRCKSQVKDHVNRFWTVIEYIQVNGAIEVIRRNLVFFVIFSTLLLWIPIGCVVHFCVDKKERAIRRQEYTKMIIESRNEFD